MGHRWVCAFVLLSGVGFGQVTGTFSMEKTVFAVGEPVFVSLTLQNVGNTAEEVETADPYSFCSGYNINVTNDAAPPVACFLQSYGGSCGSGSIRLAPGESRIERILLNYQNTSLGKLNPPVRAAGDYTVDASRDVAYVPTGAGSQLFTSSSHSEAHAVYSIHVDRDLKVVPGTYDRFVQQLESKDYRARDEAARTLATIAPPALEPLLLTFATSKDVIVSSFAPMALANLGTRASFAAMAQMLLQKKPGTYEHMTAADLLGKTHDPAWLPLLMEVADQHGGTYLGYAAESGGEKAIPLLIARLRGAHPQSAVYALGRTGSRSAVPVLISLLGTQVGRPDGSGQDLAITANAALTQLTHVYAEQGSYGSAIPGWRNRWQQWWLNAGSSAAIYRADECVADTKLP